MRVGKLSSKLAQKSGFAVVYVSDNADVQFRNIIHRTKLKLEFLRVFERDFLCLLCEDLFKFLKNIFNKTHLNENYQ
jgi:hypothetical protein